MLEPVTGIRVVATPASLETLSEELDAVMLRIAADEAFVMDVDDAELDDVHAIVEVDTGWSALRVSTPQMVEFLASAASWELPLTRPVFVQGMVAGIAAKVLVEDQHSLLVVPRAFSAEMTERLPEAWAR